MVQILSLQNTFINGTDLKLAKHIWRLVCSSDFIESNKVLSFQFIVSLTYLLYNLIYILYFSGILWPLHQQKTVMSCIVLFYGQNKFLTKGKKGPTCWEIILLGKNLLVQNKQRILGQNAK